MQYTVLSNINDMKIRNMQYIYAICASVYHICNMNPKYANQK